MLSNLTGAKRTANGVTSLFLSREIPAPAAGDAVEALVMSSGALLQLTSDGPAPATQQLAAQVTDHPVYVHQGDPPPITPPAGLSGAPARGVSLSRDVPDDVFAFITLSGVRADEGRPAGELRAHVAAHAESGPGLVAGAGDGGWR